MKVIVDQPCGAGDIFILQRAITALSKNHEVIHPVSPLIYPEIKERLKSKAEIIKINDSRVPEGVLGNYVKPVQSKGAAFIPFNQASQIYPGCVMRAKYKLIGMEINGWQEDFNFSCDLEKENKLTEILELPEEFNLVNRNFGTGGTHVKREVRPKNDLPVVEMRFIPGFNLFDWSCVIEKAAGIWTVDSSLLFLAEKLNLHAEKLEMWARWNNYESIDGLFLKLWHYN